MTEEYENGMPPRGPEEPAREEAAQPPREEETPGGEGPAPGEDRPAGEAPAGEDSFAPEPAPGDGAQKEVEPPVPDLREPEYPQAQPAAPQPPQPQPPQGGWYGAAQPPWGGYGAAPGTAPWPGYVPGGAQAQPGAYAGQAGPQPGYQPPAYAPGYGAPYGVQPAYGYPQAYGGPAPRRKLPLALKVFLWVASALAAGAILGFCVYLGYSASTHTGVFQAPYEDYLPELPYEDEDPGAQEDAPEEEAEQPAQPQVDVTPNTQGILIQQEPEGQELDAQEVYDKVVQSTVTVTVRRDPASEKADSTGTGIIATSDGYIITNAHVVLNSKSVYVKVTTYDGQEYDAVVVGSDRTTDLAVIKTNDHGFAPAEFGDAEELSIGEWVLAIGNPGGERFSSSLTRGIISGLDREVGEYSENGMTYIQTDAAINPGNSGGPLVNMYGQVVGINSSKIITEGYEGMGFAIPVSKAKDILDQLLSGGYVQGRTRLGIMGREIDSTLAMVYGVPQGFQISELPEDSAFAGTEAQVGDIITALDGERVTNINEIANLLLRYAPGDQVTVTLYRPGENGLGGRELEVTITLLEDRGETQQ